MSTNIVTQFRHQVLQCEQLMEELDNNLYAYSASDLDETINQNKRLAKDITDTYHSEKLKLPPELSVEIMLEALARYNASIDCYKVELTSPKHSSPRLSM